MVKRKIFSSKEELEQLYIEQEKSTHEIGELLKVDSKTIWCWLKKHGIPIRSRSESLQGEKNYMYGKLHTEEFKRKVSEKLKGKPSPSKGKKIPNISLNHADFSGEKNPFYGKKHTDETKKRIRLKKTGVPTHSLEERLKRKEFMKAQWLNPTLRDKRITSMTIAQNRPKTKEKISKASRKRWSNPEYKEMVLKKVIKKLHKRPNIPENKLIEVARKHDLPIEYVGDGSLIINGCNPDFIVSNERKIIEIFGRTFHDPKHSYLGTIPWERQKTGRKAIFSEAGYDTLILWDDELGNEELLIERIGGFINN